MPSGTGRSAGLDFAADAGAIKAENVAVVAVTKFKDQDLVVESAPFVLEVNTLPGMTETSLLPKAAAAAGLSYEQLCQRMIELALKRWGGVATAA